MKLIIEIAGQTHEVDFAHHNGTAQLIQGGANHTAQVGQPEPGLFTIVLNQRVYRCLLDTLPDGRTEAVVNGQRFPVTVRDKKHLRGNVGNTAASGKATLTSPMPGKVVRVLCAVGDEVAAEQGLLVVEAMKMQNEVLAPRAGKVTEVRVSEGQTVNAGEVLAVVA